MSETKSVEIHQFHIEKKQSGKESTQVHFSTVDTFQNFVTNLFEIIDEFGVEKGSKKVANIMKKGDKSVFKTFDKQGILSGMLLSGNYGNEESVVDVDNIEEEVFGIKKNHAVKKPFFFLVCVSPLKDTGFIILEKHGVNSINSVFSYFLHKLMAEKYSDHKIVIKSFIEPEVTKKYVKDGTYKEVALVRSYLPADVAERYNLGRFATDDFVIELSIKPKRNKRFPTSTKNNLVKLFEGRQIGYFSSEQFTELGFDENSQIKVVSSYNGKERTVNLSGTMKMRPYYDVEVKVDASGHSNYESIHKESVALLKSFGLELFNE